MQFIQKMEMGIVHCCSAQITVIVTVSKLNESGHPKIFPNPLNTSLIPLSLLIKYRKQPICTLKNYVYMGGFTNKISLDLGWGNYTLLPGIEHTSHIHIG